MSQQQQQQDNDPPTVAASAVAQSDALNATLLASQAERTVANLQTKNKSLTQQTNSYQSEIGSLNDKLTELQNALKTKLEEADKIGEQAKSERVKLKVAEERERDVTERMARADVEADSLRQEISRLSANNNALSAQVTELQSSSTLSSSSTAPLQYENTRLKTELSSLNSHCKWLEDELKSRSNQGAEEKIRSAKLIQELRAESNDVKKEYDEVLAQVSSLSMQNESYRRRVEIAQRELLEKDQDHADIVHELKLEIQSERRLLSLNKENFARLEERYNDAVRTMESMKSLAAAAENDREQEVLVIRTAIEKEYHNALGQVENENEKRIAEYQKHLDEALIEKAQIEDEFMGASSRNAITADDEGQVLQLTGGEPMTLTKLYEKLADAQDDARKERADKKRLELYLERVQKEIESAVPRQRHERQEYELAMTQNQEIHSRLNEAWEESNTARRELQQVQRELSTTSRECNELRLENSDMAKQVQTLLQKSLGGEDLAAEIQDQNQRLMKEHHRMSTSISEFQEKLDNDNVQQQLEELESMKKESENQSRLVANIVQQRDLYRALLNKNDQALLAEYGADGAIIAAKDQIEKYTEVESRNKSLQSSVAKLNADLISVTNEKIGVEERLVRLDAHSNEICLTNTKLQSEITAAHAASARSNAEATFHVEKVGRLEDALEVARIDLHRANDDKKSLQRLSENLQSVLSVSKNEQSKVEEQLRQVTVQVRLAEANCSAIKETEARLNAENDSLRSELARHVALHESMQKIEASLSSRGNVFQHRLEADLTKLTASLASEKSQHNLVVEKLQNELEDTDLRLKDAGKQKEQALAKALSAKDDLIKANEERNSIVDKCASLETELNAAKIKLGDPDADTSDQEKIENLSNELAAAKAELEAANKQVQDYKAMAQSSEKTLESSTTASVDFKKITMAQIKELKDELKTVNAAATAKQEALEDLTKDLSTSRGEQEKVMDDLKAKSNSLKTEIETCKSNQTSSETQRTNAVQEMKIYKAEATSSKDNYERELALHADARKELQQNRVRLEEETRLHHSTKSQLDNFNGEISSERRAWEDSTRRMEESQKHAESRLLDAQDQNKLLHNQLSTLNDVLIKTQSEKVDAAADSEEDTTISAVDDSTTLLGKQISELREIIRFQREEKDVIETQLDSARRKAERERAAAEIAKKSLDQLRREVDLLMKKSDQEDSASSVKLAESLDAKSRQAEDQLVLLRESNAMLRIETEKLRAAVDLVTNEAASANGALEPAHEKCRAFEVDKSVLEAEKASLGREVDLWKGRVEGLVKKFNQIDPEEHSIALKKAEDAEKLCSILRSEKVTAEDESTKTKSLVSRLNKELSKQRSLVTKALAELANANAEKKEVEKSNSGSADIAKKDLEEIKKAKDSAENALKAAKLQVVAQDKRVDNLKKILRQNRTKVVESQQKLDAAIKKEKEALQLLSEEKLAHQAALTQTSNSIPTAQTEELDAVMAPSPPGIVEQALVESSASSQKEPPSQTTSLSEIVEEKVPPIPKVPEEGFNFVASKDVSLVEATSDEADSKSSDDKKCSKSPNLKATSVSGTKPTLKESLKKGKQSSSLSGQDSAPKKEAELTPEESLEKGKQSSSPSGQDPALRKEGQIEENVTNSSSGPLTPSISTDKASVASSKRDPPTSKPATSASSSKNEGSLRERLLSKKRALAQKIGAQPPTKRPTSTVAVASADLQPQGAAVVVQKNTVLECKADTNRLKKILEEESKALPVVKNEEKTSESAELEKPKAKSSEEPSAVPTTQKAVFGLSANAAPFNIFGASGSASTFGSVNSSGAPPSNPFGQASPGTVGSIFGKQTSKPEKAAPAFGKPVNPAAPAFGKPVNPAAPVFGKPVNPATPSSSGGAFLDLKPPGSGSSAPLVFGSSSNITLPTPSKDKVPVGQQPFSAFQGKPFGSNPFVSATSSASPFGGMVGTKKRLLETKHNEQDQSSKILKVDEQSSQVESKSEDEATPEIVEAKPETKS